MIILSSSRQKKKLRSTYTYVLRFCSYFTVSIWQGLQLKYMDSVTEHPWTQKRAKVSYSWASRLMRWVGLCTNTTATQIERVFAITIHVSKTNVLASEDDVLKQKHDAHRWDAPNPTLPSYKHLQSFPIFAHNLYPDTRDRCGFILCFSSFSWIHIKKQLLESVVLY